MSMDAQLSVSKPKVFDYLSGISFLQDYYNYRKRTERLFSFEIWTSELGFKSKSFLKMILSGDRQVTEDFIVEYECLSSLKKIHI